MISNFEYMTHFMPEHKGKSFRTLESDVADGFALTLDGEIANCLGRPCSECLIYKDKKDIACSTIREQFLNAPYKNQDVQVKAYQSSLSAKWFSIGRVIGFAGDCVIVITKDDKLIKTDEYELYNPSEIVEKLRKLKKDDPIYVFSNIPRHFAYFDEDTCTMYYYKDGLTSFTAPEGPKGLHSLGEGLFDKIKFVE